MTTATQNRTHAGIRAGGHPDPAVDRRPAVAEADGPLSGAAGAARSLEMEVELASDALTRAAYERLMAGSARLGVGHQGPAATAAADQRYAAAAAAEDTAREQLSRAQHRLARARAASHSRRP